MHSLQANFSVSLVANEGDWEINFELFLALVSMIRLHDFLYFIFDKATGGGGREQMLLFMNIFLFVSIYFHLLSLVSENVFGKLELCILLFIIAFYLFFYARKYLIFGNSDKILSQYSNYKFSRFMAIIFVAFSYVCVSFLFFYTILSMSKKYLYS